MSSKKHRLALIVSLAAVLVIFAGCMANRSVRSSGGDVRAMATPVETAPTETVPTEKPSPPAEPLGYTVTSVKGKRQGGKNCVIARVMVANHRATHLDFGKYSSFFSPFKLLNAEGRKVRSIKKALTIDWGISPGEEGSGSISFCAAGIASGSRVTLHHGKKKWKVGIPKPKPKPAPKPKRKVEAPRVPPKSSGGGAYPGYTGPRCYAPGGKTWRPC